MVHVSTCFLWSTYLLYIQIPPSGLDFQWVHKTYKILEFKSEQPRLPSVIDLHTFADHDHYDKFRSLWIKLITLSHSTDMATTRSTPHWWTASMSDVNVSTRGCCSRIRILLSVLLLIYISPPRRQRLSLFMYSPESYLWFLLVRRPLLVFFVSCSIPSMSIPEWCADLIFPSDSLSAGISGLGYLGNSRWRGQ